MPIFEQTYRRWNGTLKTGGLRWLPIFKVGIRERFKKRAFILFYIASQIPFLVFAIMLIASSLKPDTIHTTSDFFELGPSFFSRFLHVQLPFVFLMSLFAGAPLINRDYTTNALQLYLSKPITTLDYILGKASIIGFLILSITAVPEFLLFIMRILMKNEPEWILPNLWVLFAALAYSIIVTLYYSFLILFLSSVTKNGVFAAVSLFLVYGVSAAVGAILYGLTRIKLFMYISLDFNDGELNRLFFGNIDTFDSDRIYSINPLYSLLIMAAITLGCFLYIRKRVGKIEVIQ